MDDAMKESVKITVIAAGFREVAGRKTQQRPSYLPKTWKASREQPTGGNIAPQQTNVVQQVARNVADVFTKSPPTIWTCRHSCAARHKKRNLLKPEGRLASRPAVDPFRGTMRARIPE